MKKKIWRKLEVADARPFKVANARRIRYLLTIYGVSKEKFAEDIGVSTSLIYKWCVNENLPQSIRTIWKMADYFNVSIDYLLGRELDTWVKEPKGGKVDEETNSDCKLNNNTGITTIK